MSSLRYSRAKDCGIERTFSAKTNAIRMRCDKNKNKNDQLLLHFLLVKFFDAFRTNQRGNHDVVALVVGGVDDVAVVVGAVDVVAVVVGESERLFRNVLSRNFLFDNKNGL